MRERAREPRPPYDMMAYGARLAANSATHTTKSVHGWDSAVSLSSLYSPRASLLLRSRQCLAAFAPSLLLLRCCAASHCCA